jgi:hypothetical protein
VPHFQGADILAIKNKDVTGLWHLKYLRRKVFLKNSFTNKPNTMEEHLYL